MRTLRGCESQRVAARWVILVLAAMVLAVVVTACGGSESPDGDFGVTVDPTEEAILPGGQASFDVQIVPTDDFAATVSFQLEELPSALDATVDDPVDGSATLLVQADADAPSGRYDVSLSARGGGRSHDATVTVVVEQARAQVLAIETDATVSAVDATITYDPSHVVLAEVGVPNPKVLAAVHDDGDGTLKLRMLSLEPIQGRLAELAFRVAQDGEPALSDGAAFDASIEPIDADLNLAALDRHSVSAPYDAEARLEQIVEAQP